MDNFKETNKIEQQEDLIDSQMINPQELVDIIYKGERLPQDQRFLSVDDGGVFKYFAPRDLFQNVENKIYSIVKNNQEILALGELEKDPHKANNYWIKFLSVDPKYRDRGYASRLAEEIFKFAKNKNISLQSSSYTSEGEERLKNLFNKLAKKFEVDFIDGERGVWLSDISK